MTPLASLIRAEIAATGPMRLDRYMALCLGHPEHGYYHARMPFGRSGDFVTAPEISQMFGELLGLWAAQIWLDTGQPAPLRLVELGPGRGTLMADALRAMRAVPGLREAADIWLIETSPALRAEQARAVPDARWAERLDDVPPGPLILFANEFFDALPIRQFHRRDGRWCERQVGVDGDRLVWGLGPAIGDLPADAPERAVLERCPAGESVAEALGARLAAGGGAALVIDYGAEAPETGGGDTLQAVAGHARTDPLASPGEADLTAHVDFSRLAWALRSGGALVCPPVTQGMLLEALGIGPRAARLAAANPDQAEALEAARHRLTHPKAMGRMFKVLAACGPGLHPPGFREPR